MFLGFQEESGEAPHPREVRPTSEAPVCPELAGTRSGCGTEAAGWLKWQKWRTREGVPVGEGEADIGAERGTAAMQTLHIPPQHLWRVPCVSHTPAEARAQQG